MRPHGLFEVTGNRKVMGHLPGEQFEARINHAMSRACQRGDITFIRHITPALQPGSYRLPVGWLSTPTEGS